MFTLRRSLVATAVGIALAGSAALGVAAPAQAAQATASAVAAHADDAGDAQTQDVDGRIRGIDAGIHAVAARTHDADARTRGVHVRIRAFLIRIHGVLDRANVVPRAGRVGICMATRSATIPYVFVYRSIDSVLEGRISDDDIVPAFGYTAADGTSWLYSGQNTTGSVLTSDCVPTLAPATYIV